MNVTLFSVFLNSYNALLARKLSLANLVQDGMEQIHPDDLEEMDIKWHMAMAVHRAKNKPGHFSRECPEPKVEKGSSTTSSQEKEAVAPGESKALVSQQTARYDWGDQIHELTMKVSNHALIAKIEDTEKITQLRYANTEHKRSENIFKDKIEADSQVRKKGNPWIGYHAVEHPFNGNFTSMPSVQHEDVEMEYGVGRKPDQPSSSIQSTQVIVGPSVQHVNVTNPSKSCVETGLVEGIVEDCESDDELEGHVFNSKSLSFKNTVSGFSNSTTFVSSGLNVGLSSGTSKKGNKLKTNLKSTFVKSGTLEKEEKQIMNGKNFQFVQNKNRSSNRESSKPSTSQSNSKKLPQRFTKSEFYEKFDNHYRAFKQNVRNGDRNYFKSNHRNYDRNDNQMFDRSFLGTVKMQVTSQVLLNGHHHGTPDTMPRIREGKHAMSVGIPDT
ncbi:hypothetical protein L1987_34185 [Smallanthus sonchifolius]|uniref:Uncharacterized protein n=1 Tax=Smallanthus sonchifolius TaxID=185202 RepID=A0ACB9HUC5_9ASTR|nr:hypothetical protein L1987_34185 [Smallanthus sonchifolius]